MLKKPSMWHLLMQSLSLPMISLYFLNRYDWQLWRNSHNQLQYRRLFYIIAHVIMVPHIHKFCFGLGVQAHDLAMTLIKCLCSISSSLVYFTNYISPWPFMHHVFSSCIFKYGKSIVKKGWTLEKSTSNKLRCSCMTCVFLNPCNLSKLLLAEKLVHEQQKTYVVIVNLSFLQTYLLQD